MTSLSVLAIFSKFEKSIKIRLVLSGFLSVISALADLISIGMLLPVVLSYTTPEKLLPYLKYLWFEDFNNVAHYIIFIYAIFFIFAQILKITILWFNSYFFDMVKKDISKKIIYGILNKSEWAVNIRHQSYYLNLMTTEVNLFIQMCVKNYVNVIHEIIFLTLILILGFSYIKESLLIIIVSIIPLFIFIRAINNFRLSKLADYRKLADESKMIALQQIFTLFKDIYVSQKKTYFSSIYDSKLDRLLFFERAQSIIRSSLKPLSEIYIVLIITAIAFIFYDDINYDNSSMLTLLIATLIVIFKVLPSLNKLQTSLYDIKYISTTSEHILELTSRVNLDKSNDFDNICSITSTNQNSDGFYIDNLIFSYPGSGSNIINIPSLRIPNNGLILIKGRSGSGKSTLVDLMLGILKPTHGSIIFNGRSVRYNDEKYLNLIGYVGQNIYLVNGTLAENIAFGVEKDLIDMDRVAYLLNSVGLGDLIFRNKLMLDQIVVGADSQFSGGEKQRIGIARALYKSPSILFLDEITSSLDYETRCLIYKIIEEISKKRLCTIVLITHDENIFLDGDFTITL